MNRLLMFVSVRACLLRIHEWADEWMDGYRATFSSPSTVHISANEFNNFSRLTNWSKLLRHGIRCASRSAMWNFWTSVLECIVFKEKLARHRCSLASTTVISDFGQLTIIHWQSHSMQIVVVFPSFAILHQVWNENHVCSGWRCNHAKFDGSAVAILRNI